MYTQEINFYFWNVTFWLSICYVYLDAINLFGNIHTTCARFDPEQDMKVKKQGALEQLQKSSMRSLFEVEFRTQSRTEPPMICMNQSQTFFGLSFRVFQRIKKIKICFPFFKKAVIILLYIKIFISGLLGGVKKIKSTIDSSLRILDKEIHTCLPICLSLVCLPMISSYAVAETVSYQSSLVWRADGLGDYILPEIKPDSTYEINSDVATKGVIKSITANWKFEGAVNLAVSADGGLHYTPIVNGVPLISGFSQGSNLKWKASLGAESKLNEVDITYTDFSGVAGDFGNPLLSGFQYRKSFFVHPVRSSVAHGATSNGVEGSLYNYQIKIKVGESKNSKGSDFYCDGHIKNNFQDIRFTAADGETLLPYYLEKVTGDSSYNRVAEFFVKIPQIPMEGITLFVYYGNSTAQSLSDPRTTFDFYDDFSSSSLDKEQWSTHLSAGGSLAITKAGLLLDAASVISKSFQFQNGIIEYSATAETGYESRLVIHQEDPDSETDTTEVAYSSSYDGAEHCIAVGNIVKANDSKRIAALSRYDYRITADDDTLVFERYLLGFGEKQASVDYRDPQLLKKGFIGIKTAGTGRGRSLTLFHWIRVRQYVKAEPVIDQKANAPEEETRLPIYNNTTLSPRGELVLAEGQKTGSYITKEAVSPYDIRIMVPSWEGSDISVDVSADAGKTYKNNCSNQAYYYAGRLDFSKGRGLVSRVDFMNNSSRLQSLSTQYASGNIVVLSPNGGEALRLGSKYDITWSAWDYERNYPMQIEYSGDGGKTFTTIAHQTQNSGHYVWSVPAVLNAATNQAKIRVCDAYDNPACDESDNVFSIEAR